MYVFPDLPRSWGREGAERRPCANSVCTTRPHSLTRRSYGPKMAHSRSYGALVTSEFPSLRSTRGRVTDSKLT
jgi:hypothetical protein